MEQFKRNMPYILFLAFAIKLIGFNSATLLDVLALLIAGLGLAFFELRIENKKFTEITSEINKLQASLALKDTKIDELRQQVSAVRTVQGLKVQSRTP